MTRTPPEKAIYEKAIALIETFRGALAKGYRHFDGRELKTVEEILTALGRDGEITIKEPPK